MMIYRNWENNLVINVKKGKTEFVLYETAKRISMQQLSGQQSVLKVVSKRNLKKSDQWYFLIPNVNCFILSE